MNLVLTHEIPDFRGGVHLFTVFKPSYASHRFSPEFRYSYRVTQLRIDGVHCPESAGTGPVVPKVVSSSNHGPIGMRLSFSIPTTRYWYDVAITC